MAIVTILVPAVPAGADFQYSKECDVTTTVCAVALAETSIRCDEYPGSSTLPPYVVCGGSAHFGGIGESLTGGRVAMITDASCTSGCDEEFGDHPLAVAEWQPPERVRAVAVTFEFDTAYAFAPDCLTYALSAYAAVYAYAPATSVSPVPLFETTAFVDSSESVTVCPGETP